MPRDGASRNRFTITDFLLRLFSATLLVMATYNPSGFSFVDWVDNAWAAGSVGPMHYFFGVVLLIGWVVLLRATFNSLGLLGLGLGAALLGTFIWMLLDLGVLKGDSITFYTWISLVCISAILALGLSFSHIWRRLTGQMDVDDFDGD